MIHISTDELFKKIHSEHNCEFENQELQKGGGEKKVVATCGGVELDQKQTDSSNLSSVAAANLQFERRLSAEAQIEPQATRRRSSPSFVGSSRSHSEFCRDMSSILPATYSSFRDSNNNTTGPNEDEVQAVLITGCGSKIGTNIAVAFAARGLKVALVDFDINQTETVARECQEKSPRNRVPVQIVADISQLAEAHKVIDRTIEAFGRLDVLVNTVNNAGLVEAKFGASGDDDPHVFEQYHKIIANNMHAVTYLCISAAPYLRKTKGSIVNVSGITNNETGSYKFAYRMSKAGISTLTKCLATDLAPDIKVICVSPKSDTTETFE